MSHTLTHSCFLFKQECHTFWLKKKYWTERGEGSIEGRGLTLRELVRGHCSKVQTRLARCPHDSGCCQHVQSETGVGAAAGGDPVEGPATERPHPPQSHTSQLPFFFLKDADNLCKLMPDLSFDCIIEILLINFSGSHLIIQIKIQRKAKRMIMPPHSGNWRRRV